MTGTDDGHCVVGGAIVVVVTLTAQRRARLLDLGVGGQVLESGLIGHLAGGGLERSSLLLVTATGKGNVERCAEEAELLVQRVEMLVASLDRPLEGAVGQLDGVPEDNGILVISI